jgi:hypothetical protein
MLKQKLISLLMLVIFLSSCGLSKPLQQNNESQNEVSAYSDADIIASEKCWLLSFGLDFGDFTDNSHECTKLARVLTNAPEYGEDNSGNDYIAAQQSAGNPLPLLHEVKDAVAPCDVLILTGDAYPVGHTVIVYQINVPTDKIYIIEQNFPEQSPINHRELEISAIENSTYVILNSGCKQDPCSIGDTNNVVVAAPDDNVQSLENSTIEFATLTPDDQSMSGFIVYIRDNNIWQYNLSAGEEKKLTTDSDYSKPSISSDGKKIAFVKSFGDPEQDSIGILDLATGTENIIVQPQKTGTLENQYFQFSNLHWVNDNSELYFNTSDGRVQGDDSWAYDLITKQTNKGLYAGLRNFRMSPWATKYTYVNWTNVPPLGASLVLYDFTNPNTIHD